MSGLFYLLLQNIVLTLRSKEKDLSTTQADAYKQQISELLLEVVGSIEVTKKYFKDAQMETWNQVRKALIATSLYSSSCVE